MVKNKICVTGWYYPKWLYKQLKKSSFDIHIVAHRHNRILDKLNFNYSVIKNIGIESHMYDWYIKNIWDKKSNVLFIHDDIEANNINDVFKFIFKKATGTDYSCIFGSKDLKNKKNGARCLYFSPKLINLFLQKYNGIWYDKYNKGYVWGNKKDYDPKIYTYEYDEKYCEKVGKHIEGTLLYFVKKYKLKYKKIICKELLLCRRGDTIKKEIRSYMLIDNSIFGRANDNLDKITFDKNKRTEKGRWKHYYTKWYNFYFNNIRLDNLNILEIGIGRGLSLEMWKEYFKNSDIYGIEKNKFIIKKRVLKRFKIFVGEKIDKYFLKDVCEKITEGFDIIIDNGSDILEDQIDTFEILFEELNPGGIYVIEDLQRCYKKEFIIGKNCIDFLKEKVDDINYKGRFDCNNFEHLVKEKYKLEKYERLIAGISFFSGICFIFKKYCK